MTTGKLVKAIRYNMFGFPREVVEVYCDLAKVKPETLRKVATPGMDDHQLKPEGFQLEGNLYKDAAKIIMKALTVPVSLALKHFGLFAVAPEK